MPQRFENLNKPQDIGQLLQRMSLQDQALYRLSPEQNQANAAAAGPLLLKRIKEGFTGFLKGNSTDIINTIQQVADLIPTGRPVNDGKPLGDEIFEKVTGSKPSGSSAEDAGSMVSIGGPAKKLLAGLVGAGTVAKIAHTTKQAMSGVNEVSDITRQAERGMIVAADKVLPKGYIETAKELTEEGVSNSTLFNSSGAFYDKDRALKAFLSDKDAKVNKKVLAEMASGETHGTDLATILDHPKLYAAYPDLRQVMVYRNDRPGLGGSYNPQGDYITTNVDNPDFTRSALLHETQHAIQRREGFSSGTNVRAQLPFNVEEFQKKITAAKNSDDPSMVRAANRFKEAGNREIKKAEVKYMNTAGEQEARFTQMTENMSEVEGNKQLMEYLRIGETPQTWDTKPIPSGK